MTKELEITLRDMLEKSIELAEKTGKFVIEQGGDLLHQFFLWHTTMHIMGVLLGLFIIVVVGMLIPRLWGVKYENRREGSEVYYRKIVGRWFDTYNDHEVPAIISIVIFSIIGGVQFFYQVYKLVYVLVAPKLYLLDYFIN